jgi:hypothetical protein
MVYYNCLDYPDSRTETRCHLCMISHLYYELHHGGFVWFWGFASELELARWGAVHPAKSLVA